MLSQPPLSAAVDLPLSTAIWVLSAHLLTVISPLVVIWACQQNWQHLSTALFSPTLLVCSAVALILASGFESAQNAAQRWYLTEIPKTWFDWLFNCLITTSLAFNVVASAGQWSATWIICSAAVLLYAISYLRDWPTAPYQGLLGGASTLALFFALGDPIVFLQLVTVFLTLFFLDILLQTQAQSMHGFTTMVNGVGLMCIPIAISNSAAGTATPWIIVLGLAGISIVAALLSRKSLLLLEATQRPV